MGQSVDYEYLQQVIEPQRYDDGLFDSDGGELLDWYGTAIKVQSIV